MKNLTKYIKSDKSSLISLSERLIINKDFKSLDYEYEWFEKLYNSSNELSYHDVIKSPNFLVTSKGLAALIYHYLSLRYLNIKRMKPMDALDYVFYLKSVIEDGISNDLLDASDKCIEFSEWYQKKKNDPITKESNNLINNILSVIIDGEDEVEINITNTLNNFNHLNTISNIPNMTIVGKPTEEYVLFVIMESKSKEIRAVLMSKI